MLTRYSLYQDMKVVTSHERVAGSERVVCDEYRRNHTCRRSHKEYDYVDSYGPFASWQGCVEARPYPYNTTDDPASGGSNNTGIGFGDPATMFVPMFAPDEPGNHWYLTQDPDEAQPVTYGASNNWWNDDPSSSTGRSRAAEHGEVLHAAPDQRTGAAARGPGRTTAARRSRSRRLPTSPCRKGSQPSTRRSTAWPRTAIPTCRKGMAWGWRTVSSGEPFTEGRPDSEKGNDKVVIVLTDGANTYTAPNNDPARQQVDLRGLWLSAARLQRHRHRPAADRTPASASSTIRAATTPLRSTITWRRCATTPRRRTSWS